MPPPSDLAPAPFIVGVPPGHEQRSRQTVPFRQVGTNPKMKVVLGRQSLAALGGTETYAFPVARELEPLGHDATLVAEELRAGLALGRAADRLRSRA